MPHLLKLIRRGVLSGYVVTPDSAVKVFIPVQDDRLVRTVQAELGTSDIEVAKFELMSLGPYARGWCIDPRCKCSPPVGGYTCHHCASLDNRNSTGLLGYIFALPHNIEVEDRVLVQKDFPFRGAGLRNYVTSLFCKVFDIPSICANVGVNRYDLAKLQYNEVPPELGNYSAVIFAGVNRGPYAVAFPFDNIPDDLKPQNLVHPSRAKSLEAYVVHCDTYAGQWRCPTVKRKYRYYGSGAITVYAYGRYYTFTDVVFLTATDVPFRIDCCDDSKLVTWAVQPGYSGSVVFEPKE